MKMKITFCLLVVFALLLSFPPSVFSDGSSMSAISIAKTEIPVSPSEIKGNEIRMYESQIQLDKTPNLSEIIAFHIALIAFFIPLSVEMVGRISERYGSGIISNYYKREMIPWAIFGLSILNIFLSVFLMFFSIASKAFNYISLGLFTLTLILIIPFLFSLYQYLTDINAVIKKVTKDVKDII